MWHFSYTSVLRSYYVVGSSASKTVWRHPAAYRQLHSCIIGVRKPSCRHISRYISSVGQLPCNCTVTGRSTSLLNFGSIWATQSRSLRCIPSQRSAFSKQIRHASNTKTLPTAASSQVTKRELPKVSDVYRLLSLAKPEKWKLLGESAFIYCAFIFCLAQNTIEKQLNCFR